MLECKATVSTLCNTL